MIQPSEQELQSLAEFQDSPAHEWLDRLKTNWLSQMVMEKDPETLRCLQGRVQGIDALIAQIQSASEMIRHRKEVKARAQTAAKAF